MRTFFSLLFILVITAIAALGIAPDRFDSSVRALPLVGATLADADLTLGLDLQGGTHLDYRIVTAGIRERDVDAVVRGVREVIERRVDRLGVAEPNIFETRVGDERHIIVELAGIRDVEEAKAIVGKTIQLEFSEQKTEEDPAAVAAIVSRASDFLAAATAEPARFDQIFSDFEKKPETALTIDSEWRWVADLPEELTAVVALPAGAVYPELLAPAPGSYTFKNGQIVEQQGFSVVRLLEKETGAERIIEEPEARRASHVLVAFAGAERADESVTRSDDEARELANEILSRVQAGEDFAALSSEYSDDPTAASAGGDLGFFARGQMTPAFEDAVFDTATPGLIDRAIRTSFGYHIIRYDELRPATSETRQEDRVKLATAFFDTTPSGWQPTGLTGQHFRSASVGSDPTTMRPVVNIYFTDVAVGDNTVDWWELVYWLVAIFAAMLAVSYGLGALTTEDRKNVRRDTVIALVALVVFAGAMYQITQFSRVVEPVEPEAEDTVISETDKAGVDLFAELTKRNVGKPIAIFLDGEPIIDGDPFTPGLQDYAPVVQTEITNGQAVITGLSSYEEANQLAQNLNTGAIPAPIALAGQYTIGASLGEEALRTSLVAGSLGLVVVMLFMVLYYRVPGIVSALALGIYGALLIFALSAGGVVLTLAGVAGVILSIGMAVDANILIFERMKEELKIGKPVDAAIEDGFTRAWTSIRASNVSSLITCLILFWFGSSIIKGFALTLAIGIVISMFTAIFVTRAFLRTLNGRWSSRAKVLFRAGLN